MPTPAKERHDRLVNAVTELGVLKESFNHMTLADIRLGDVRLFVHLADRLEAIHRDLCGLTGTQVA